MNSKLNLLLRAQQRYHSTSEIPKIDSINPTILLNTERSVSQQLINLQIDYAILKDLRKKSTNKSGNEVLDGMIQELRRLKDRLKYMAKRTGNIDAQVRRRKLLDPSRTDSGFVSDAEGSSDDETLAEERESSGSIVSFAKSNDVGLASRASTTVASAGWLFPLERTPKLIQPEEIWVKEFENVQM